MLNGLSDDIKGSIQQAITFRWNLTSNAGLLNPKGSLRKTIDGRTRLLTEHLNSRWSRGHHPQSNQADGSNFLINAGFDVQVSLIYCCQKVAVIDKKVVVMVCSCYEKHSVGLSSIIIGHDVESCLSNQCSFPKLLHTVCAYKFHDLIKHEVEHAKSDEDIETEERRRAIVGQCISVICIGAVALTSIASAERVLITLRLIKCGIGGLLMVGGMVVLTWTDQGKAMQCIYYAGGMITVEAKVLTTGKLYKHGYIHSHLSCLGVLNPNSQVKDTMSCILDIPFEFLHGSTLSMPIITPIWQQLLQSINDSPNVFEKSVYETSKEVVRCSTYEIAFMVLQKILVIMTTLNQSMEAHKFLLGEMEKQNEIHGFLYGCLQVAAAQEEQGVIIMAHGKAKGRQVTGEKSNDLVGINQLNGLTDALWKVAKPWTKLEYQFHGAVFVHILENFVWDPGQRFILEDKDVLKRNGLSRIKADE